ncbi:hypothetical protein Glove_229g13 [Diversispora epigaea]|uniref:Uncharacterized protein n=1 Tax=Diversispora epigaea TaxID=1348612 RepID=A0A397IDL7_9GLOM|nr:hypothetical protein Glove_229g13 [Diversispora epigaea]
MATLTTDAYINSYKKNSTFTCTWGTASYKNQFGEVVDFSYKYFYQSNHIQDFSEGDVVNMSGKLTYEENSVYSPEGVLIVIDKARCVPPPPGIRSWNIIDLHPSAPYVNLQCQVIPDGQKPYTSIEGEMLIIETSALIYCFSPPKLRELFFTVSLKNDSPRFRAITPDRLRLNNFYAISGLLRQTTKYDDKVEFFIEACSFDLLSVQAIPTQPQGSRNVPRTAPPDDFENFIHKKFHSESPKRQRTNYDGTAKNLQEISSPDVQFPKPAVSAPTIPTPPIVPTPPIESTSITHDANLSPPSFPNPNPPNKNKFQAINHNPNKKITDFHNLDPSSFVLSNNKKKNVATATNTGSIQNIALNKLQEGDVQKPNSPTRSMSGIEDPINEEK